MFTAAATFGLITSTMSSLWMSGESPDAPILITTQEFQVDYAINQAAMPIQSVGLWMTLDRGQSWRLMGYDQDNQSPFRVQAPTEGLLGIYLVVSNAVGPSSAPPSSTTIPHRWMFVDATPPIVQLHPLQSSTSMGERIVQIQWSAMDAHFDQRPIAIEYQVPGQLNWTPMMGSPLSNTGRYDWRPPAHLSGPVSVRLTAQDLGGHVVHSAPQVVEMYTTPIPTRSMSTPVMPSPQLAVSSSWGATNGSPASLANWKSRPSHVIQRAEQIYASAVEHRVRGEYREGIAKMRDVLRLNPHAVNAIVEMAEMLYRIGDLERAKSAFELALQQEPSSRSALRGAAMVYHQRGDYELSAEYLRSILRYNPNDAEIWMNLGDVAVFQGDEVFARECYTRATQINPSSTQVIVEARQRLTLMDEASRQYRPWEP